MQNNTGTLSPSLPPSGIVSRKKKKSFFSQNQKNFLPIYALGTPKTGLTVSMP